MYTSDEEYMSDYSNNSYSSYDSPYSDNTSLYNDEAIIKNKYEILNSTESLSEKIQSESDNLLNFCPTLPNNVRSCLIILLNKFNWDVDTLSEKLMDNPNKILKECHLISQQENQQNNNNQNTCSRLKIDGQCLVCFEEGMALYSSKLCNHYYCRQCHIGHIEAKLTDYQSSLIPCIEPSCKLYLDPEFIKSLINKTERPKSFNLYQNKTVNSIVNSNPQTSWCCTPKCNGIIWVNNFSEAKKLKNYFLNTKIYKDLLKMDNDTTIQNIEINNTKTTDSNVNNLQIIKNCFNPEKLKIDCHLCNSQLCFNCSNYWHEPVTCEYLAKWKKKCVDDSETIKWIEVNCKECPKCGVNIEKNQGCNHMICKKDSCNHEFCWICLEPWVKHGNSWFKCDSITAKQQEEIEKQQAVSKNFVKKYQKCYNRYHSHEVSLKFETQNQLKLNKKMELLQENIGLSYIETEFLDKAATTLISCRRTLMYCYIFNYYLFNAGENSIDILFSDNLNDLHFKVETLSHLLEKYAATNIYNSNNNFSSDKNKKPEKSSRTNWVHKSNKNKSSIQKEIVIDVIKNTSNETKESIQEKYKEFKIFKDKIINQESYCSDRRVKLIENVIEGYDNNEWVFFE